MIHLIRHAAPAITGTMLGRSDPPRRDGFIEPCPLPVARVWSSPLRRARETAAGLFPHYEAQVLDDLAEIDLGDWNGLDWNEIETRWPADAARKLADWWAVTPPGGESRIDVERRAARAWIAVMDGPLPAAVVAHAGINAFLANLAAGVAVEGFEQSYLEVKSYAIR